jgi:hypothetical protein
MKRLVLVTLVLATIATPAVAFQCPLLIKQLKDQVTTLSPNDPKAKQARALIEEAQKLHNEASHAKSIAKAEEAAKLLGIALKKT